MADRISNKRYTVTVTFDMLLTEINGEPESFWEGARDAAIDALKEWFEDWPGALDSVINSWITPASLSGR